MWLLQSIQASRLLNANFSFQVAVFWVFLHLPIQAAQSELFPAPSLIASPGLVQIKGWPP